MKRSPFPSRRVPLKRGLPLGRGEAELSRRVPLKSVPRDRASRNRKPAAPRGAMATALTEVLACEATVAEASRFHGCDRGALEQACRKAVRVATMNRDSRTCQNCGALACDVQHRIRRGMGGTSDPRIAFGMCNLVALCRECHDKADRKRDPEMHANGFWLETDEDPAAVPVAALVATGVRVKRWLLADGGWSAEKPQAVAA